MGSAMGAAVCRAVLRHPSPPLHVIATSGPSYTTSHKMVGFSFLYKGKMVGFWYEVYTIDQSELVFSISKWW